MTLVLLVSIGFYRWYLVHVPRDGAPEPETETVVL
jgi:hypothetical protein